MVAKRKSNAAESQLAFEAISIEGGLLSPEWLSKVAQLQAGTQSEADYRIPKGLNLRDEIGRFWRMAQAHWMDFKTGRDAKADAKVIAERFVSALLRDAFGFTSLSAVVPTVLAQRTYPIGHAALSGRVPVVIAPAAGGVDTPSASFGDGSRRRSAFGLAQEYVNLQDGAVWGIASDGSVLRIVRDNASLTRPAWIEADLHRIFTEERYADFAALWLLCHESRFGREEHPAAECALEMWRNAGREEGTRAREHLRRGVEEALIALGQGFLGHPENHALRASLQDGTLGVKDYFNQLLRVIYRLIFLLTVEERGVLHPDGTTDAAKALYANGYGIRRLRERAVKRNAHDRFADLWEATQVVWRGLARGEPRLGLPALAGIFAPTHCAVLDAAKLENRALLLAVFKLAWLRENGSLARVNWRDMGPEELGSVYESLLELIPRIAGGRQFAFATDGEAKGHARKTTGSYYTPDSLVQVLLDSALEPVVADTIAKHPIAPVEALLGLSIVDPACGSGHFLLAAARRLAAHVARLEANGTPSAAEYRHALRQIVGRCIFGVDLNPMAVELCKVSLWMEAVEPGLPLTFLDSHIQHGNALLGATPELMANGVPDVAWEPIEGDDRKAASALKKRNKAEAGGQRTLDFGGAGQSDREAQTVRRAIAELDAASDRNVEDLANKEARWSSVLGSPEYRHQKLVADAWCAAFVWPKQGGELADAAPTNEQWRQLRDSQSQARALTMKIVGELAEQNRFFHWHLQFPQVFAKGGFDIVLGNPPWERVKLQEQEFFASRSDEIANAVNAASRKTLIANLPETNPQLWEEWTAASRSAEGESHFVRRSGRYPLCGKGDVNTYTVFAEHNRAVLSPYGRAGFIVPSGIATDDTTKEYFGALVSEGRLASLYDYRNHDGLFYDVGHRRFKFCLLTVTGASVTSATAEFVFFAESAEHVRDPERRYTLTATDIESLNPNTRTSPTFRTRRDADINLALYRRTGILWREGKDAHANPWRLRFMAMFHMSGDSDLFRVNAEMAARRLVPEGNLFVGAEGIYLPLVEAKMVHQFDHRYGDYVDRQAGSKDTQLPDVPETRLDNPHYQTQPRYWVSEREVASRLDESWKHQWLVGWRDICRSTDERTLIASLIPRAAVGDKLLLMLPALEPLLTACLYGSLCSFVVDYAARQKVGGTSLKYFTMRQFPVLPPEIYATDTAWHRGTTLRDWIVPRVLELTYTAWELEPFARDIGYEAPPFHWNPERRFRLRCELDAAFFHIYGVSREDVDYVMDTFPIVRKNDEKAYGEQRTKRVILEIYDALAEAAQKGKSYRTPLDPLPGALGASHGTFSPSGTPRDYAEALRTGLLFRLIRGSGATGIRTSALSRAIVWLQQPHHAMSWLDASSLADFQNILNADPLLARNAEASLATKLLDVLETEKAVTRDSKGVVRERAGASLPKWLPQTPILGNLGSIILPALERAEAGVEISTAVDTVRTGKAKRA